MQMIHRLFWRMTQNLQTTIKLFHKFTECAGLRITIDRAEVISQEKNVLINYCQN
jgi:hypothetical protein